MIKYLEQRLFNQKNIETSENLKGSKNSLSGDENLHDEHEVQKEKIPECDWIFALGSSSRLSQAQTKNTSTKKKKILKRSKRIMKRYYARLLRNLTF
jgi:hypothetical protein